MGDAACCESYLFVGTAASWWRGVHDIARSEAVLRNSIGDLLGPGGESFREVAEDIGVGAA